MYESTLSRDDKRACLPSSDNLLITGRSPIADIYLMGKRWMYFLLLIEEEEDLLYLNHVKHCNLYTIEFMVVVRLIFLDLMQP